MRRIYLALVLLSLSVGANAQTEFLGFTLSSTTVISISGANGLECTDTLVTFTGALENDGCFLGPSDNLADTTGYGFSCYVSATNQVAIRACCSNGTGLLGIAVGCPGLPATQIVRIFLRRY